MDLVTNLRCFLRVSETGSFSAVAAERGVTQPAISRQVSALEEHLGTRLVQRSTQAVVLTEEGRNLVPAARDLVHAADDIFQSATIWEKRPVGLVRIALPVSLGLYLSEHIPNLLNRYSELGVEVVMRDRAGHLVEEGLDLEVRVGDIEESTLVCRRIGSIGKLIVAAPEYLAGRAPIVLPDDLEQHNCIIHRGAGQNGVWWWYAGRAGEQTEGKVAVHGNFSADNATAVHRAALAGQGIASVSHLLVADDIRLGRLVQLLPDYVFQRAPVYITYSSRRRLPQRTRAVIDFLVTLFQQDPMLSL